MTILKRIVSGAKYATLLVMSWSVGVAVESRLDSVAPSASKTIAQATASTPPPPATQATSWWKPVTDVLR